MFYRKAQSQTISYVPIVAISHNRTPKDHLKSNLFDQKKIILLINFTNMQPNLRKAAFAVPVLMCREHAYLK